MKPLNIVLADQQPLVRAGLRMLIERIEGMVVVAEAGSGEDLLAAVAAQAPDIVVSEIALPGIDGVDIAVRVARLSPRPAMLLLASEIDASQVHGALQAGVLGLVAKSGEPAELEAALLAVSAGKHYMSPHLAGFAVDRRRARRKDNLVLPARQRQVLQMLGHGKSTREIAESLGLSIKTVETHRARLMHALGLGTMNALMHFAVRHELESGPKA